MIPKAALCLTLLAAGSAHAQPIDLLPGDPDPVARAPRELLFISPAGEPFRAPPGAAYPVATWFARADANHDGALSPEEFTADHMAFFKQLDKDADGVVDGFESGAYEKDMVPEIQPQESRGMGRPRARKGFLGFGKGPPPIPRRQGAAAYGLVNEPLPVRAADADFDYRVTTAEAKAAAARRFGLLDRDKDGRLTLAELPKTPAQLAEEMRRSQSPPPRPEPRAQEPLQPSGAPAIPEA